MLILNSNIKINFPNFDSWHDFCHLQLHVTTLVINLSD